MGRTAPTYRYLIEQVFAEWGPYRRALRTVDRAVFDRMVNHAREYGSAGSNLADLDPTTPILLSILLAQEAELARLRRAVEDLQGNGTD
ncbi:MAG: hypothetical protein KAQ96_11080 [Thermoplasmata archaeon]|nr:hypothetical protein [Thermoplasmata archaeon]MCK5414677.1 hypothetical protein [Thermoplasmata archaeon]